MKGKFIVFPEIGDIVEYTQKRFVKSKANPKPWSGPT
jgi:hypothetical protein